MTTRHDFHPPLPEQPLDYEAIRTDYDRGEPIDPWVLRILVWAAIAMILLTLSVARWLGDDLDVSELMVREQDAKAQQVDMTTRRQVIDRAVDGHNGL